MIELEGNGCCEADRGEEGVGAPIVAGGDTPPVLQLGAHIFDFVVLLIERPVIGQRNFPALVEGMQDLQPLLARASLNQSLS